MRHWVAVISLLASGALAAQVGVTATYNLNRISEAIDPEINDNLENGIEAQLHYWFRLKNQRVEFQPTIYYHTASIGLAEIADYGFQQEINLYPFDFLGDCDCPTFGKQAPQLEKGFFIQLASGIARRTWRGGGAETGVTTFVYGAGLGIDFGVNNFLTITPLATFRRGQSPFGDITVTDPNGRPVETRPTHLTSVQIGLQATFRFDHKRY